MIGGRLGDAHPFATTFAAAGFTVIAAAGILLFSRHPIALVTLFALLGLVGLSANPILVSLAVRYGGAAPTLATAMPTSIFNLGTAIGTGISGIALESPLGDIGPTVVGTSAQS